jgi:hypothetical protein
MPNFDFTDDAASAWFGEPPADDAADEQVVPTLAQAIQPPTAEIVVNVEGLIGPPVVNGQRIAVEASKGSSHGPRFGVYTFYRPLAVSRHC